MTAIQDQGRDPYSPTFFATRTLVAMPRFLQGGGQACALFDVFGDVVDHGNQGCIGILARIGGE